MKGIFPAILLALSPVTGQALSFSLEPGQDVVGELVTVEARHEDTFSDIARLHDVGYREMTAANPRTDAWIPGEGTEVVVPSSFVLPNLPREGIIINLAELRLYYFPPGGDRVETYPLGIGREGWKTPVSSGHVTRKKRHPSWTPPESIRKEAAARGRTLPPQIGPGPNNPLGDYALYLSIPGYLLHGTSRPYGVGMRVSHGCIRLYPEDIANLFPQVPVGTKVRIINQPYKAGWRDGQLYVEVHPPLAEQFFAEGFNLTTLRQAVDAALDRRDANVDWERIKEVALEHRGVPVPVYKADH
jgi:L,D-transpeptidase ErfK/SrfK